MQLLQQKDNLYNKSEIYCEEYMCYTVDGEAFEFEELNANISMEDKKDVTVWCITYNHVTYIEDALKGFLGQRGTVSYEVVVFDDASTDGTSDILRKYANIYPEILHVFIAKKNIYRNRKRKQILDSIKNVFHGKYIALCEGDDYWIDPYKLQYQYDYMEKHRKCTLFLHNAIWQNCENGEVFAGNTYPCKNSTKVSAEQLIMLYKMHPATASFFYRKDMLYAPEFFCVGPVGDYTRMLYLYTMGYIHYSSRIMSVYRWRSIGSSTSRMSQDAYMDFRHKIGMIIFLLRYDRYTNGKYQVWINNRIQRYFNGLINAIGLQEKLKECINSFVLESPMMDRECEVYYVLLTESLRQARDAKYVSAATKFFCQSKRHIVIMGVGHYAELCSSQLEKNGLRYEGFAVSKPEKTQDKFKGKNVWKLSDIPFNQEELGVIIAINPIRWDDILQSVTQAGIRNYFCPYLLMDSFKEME